MRYCRIHTPTNSLSTLTGIKKQVKAPNRTIQFFFVHAKKFFVVVKDVLHNGNYYLTLLHPGTKSRFWTKISAFVLTVARAHKIEGQIE